MDNREFSSTLPPLTPQKAAGVLRDANLGGVLRRAADMGIRALEGMDAANGLDPEEIERILDAYGRGMTLRTENGERLRIIKDIPTNRLQELAQAEKDGRLVVLPIPVGKGKLAYAIPDSFSRNQEIFTIECERLDGLEIWENLGHEIVVEIDGCEIGESDIGKTVFLTREEAEAALKKREETDNEAY